MHTAEGQCPGCSLSHSSVSTCCRPQKAPSSLVDTWFKRAAEPRLGTVHHDPTHNSLSFSPACPWVKWAPVNFSRTQEKIMWTEP